MVLRLALVVLLLLRVGPRERLPGLRGDWERCPGVSSETRCCCGVAQVVLRPGVFINYPGRGAVVIRRQLHRRARGLRGRLAFVGSL